MIVFAQCYDYAYDTFIRSPTTRKTALSSDIGGWGLFIIGGRDEPYFAGFIFECREGDLSVEKLPSLRC